VELNSPTFNNYHIKFIIVKKVARAIEIAETVYTSFLFSSSAIIIAVIDAPNETKGIITANTTDTHINNLAIENL
jgi:hypothetical protein